MKNVARTASPVEQPQQPGDPGPGAVRLVGHHVEPVGRLGMLEQDRALGVGVEREAGRRAISGRPAEARRQRRRASRRSIAGPAPPQRDERQHLVGEVRRQRRRLAGRVVGRDDLDDVEPDEVDAGQPADDRQHVPRRRPAGLGRAGSGRVGRVDDVDVEADERGPVADPVADRRGDGGRPEPEDVLGREVLEPELRPEPRPVARCRRATRAAPPRSSGRRRRAPPRSPAASTSRGCTSRRSTCPRRRCASRSR